MKTDRALDKVIAEQASHWVTVLRRKASRQELADFAIWLKSSPQHIREFLLMVAIEKELHSVDAGQEYGLHELTHSGEDNVVALTSRAEAWDPQRPTVPAAAQRWRFAAMLIASIALIVMAVVIWPRVSNTLRGSQDFTTSVGEQRSIELQDGSVVALNTGSRIEVRLTAQKREIRLLKGEALFKVARDPNRPFLVRADDAVIQAVGTQFNVYRRQEGTSVSVLEGRVRVSTHGIGSRATSTLGTHSPESGVHDAPLASNTDVGSLPTNLDAGEIAMISPSGKIVHHVATDLGSTVSWRQRRLVFQEDSLADMVHEFNRYNSSPQFRLEGSVVLQRHYTGVFDADDPESLVQLLATENDLRIERRGGEIVISAKR
jgi:transmembrane sensor